MPDLYDTLGVTRDADNATIKKAYRKKAQISHPDKGGKPEEFHAVRKAYGILSDEDKRARYDETGDDGEQLSTEEIAYQKLSAMIISIIDSVDIERENVFDLIRAFINKQINESALEINRLKLSIKKREKAIKRIKRKGKGENIITMLLQRDITGIEGRIKAKENAIADDKLLLDLAANYEHETIPPDVIGKPAWFDLSNLASRG